MGCGVRLSCVASGAGFVCMPAASAPQHLPVWVTGPGWSLPLPRPSTPFLPTCARLLSSQTSGPVSVPDPAAAINDRPPTAVAGQGGSEGHTEASPPPGPVESLKGRGVSGEVAGGGLVAPGAASTPPTVPPTVHLAAVAGNGVQPAPVGRYASATSTTSEGAEGAAARAEDVADVVADVDIVVAAGGLSSATAAPGRAAALPGAPAVEPVGAGTKDVEVVVVTGESPGPQCTAVDTGPWSCGVGVVGIGRRNLGPVGRVAQRCRRTARVACGNVPACS
jgi:hypothetical protein